MRRKSKPTGPLGLVTVAIGLGSLTACLIVPTPEISEIRNSRLDFIEPGITIRDEVEAELLSRDVFLARYTEPYAIYAEYRDAFAFLVITPTSGDGQVYGDVDDYLVVEYDDRNRVAGFERLRREGDCTTYGLCVSGGSTRDRDEDERKTPRTLVVFAPTRDDETRKRFEVAPGTCSVYAFAEGERGCDTDIVEIGTTVPGVISTLLTRADDEGYFHWTIPVSPGSTVEGILLAELPGDIVTDDPYQCSDGKKLFVEVYLSRCRGNSAVASFLELATGDGEAAVLERRLVLD